MIVLNKVTLKNACQHSDLVITPGSGLVAILGANGSGKSNVLRLIVYALTSYVDGTWGSQSDLQSDTAVTPGYVELHLQDSDHVYRVRRYFLDAVKYPDEYQADSGDVVCRRAKVNAKLAELFGIPLPLLATLIWAKQEMFDWLLCAPSAGIKAFFAEIFNAETFNTARTKLASAISSIYLPPDRSADIKNMTDEIAALTAELQQIEDRLSEGSPELPQLEEFCAGFEKQAADKIPYAVWTSEVARWEAAVTSLSTQQPEELVDVTPMQEQLDSTRRRLELLQQRQMRLRKIQDSFTRTADQEDTNCRVFQTEYNSIAADLHNADKGICPLCHTDLGSAEHVHSLIAAKYGVADIALYQKELEACITQKRAIAAAMRQRSTRAGYLCTVVQTKATAATADIKTLDADIRKAEKAYRNSQTLKARQEHASQELQRILASDHIEQDVMDQYLEVKAKRDELRSTVQNLLIAQRSNDVLHKTKTEALKQLQTEQQAHDNALLLRTVLTDIRDCFGPKRAQAVYIAHRMEALNDMLAARMQHTELPFELFFDNTDCLFKYRTADGFVHPTGHLSGAQKKICAMILQVCLYEHVQPNLDLLLLDEVDAALDPGNRVMLAEMLALLRRDSSGCIIVATREQETIDQCNNIIDITHREE